MLFSFYGKTQIEISQTWKMYQHTCTYLLQMHAHDWGQKIEL